MVKANEFDLDLNIKQEHREDIQSIITNISICTGVCILDTGKACNNKVY